MDAEPYETRGYYRTFGGPTHQGGDKEFFSSATWVQRDICARERWPFADKQFDFAVCSHTLEDLRDPLWVCSELIRVAKRGYLEVPSREWETCRGAEHPRLAGLSHHRWLIDIEGNRIRFLQKFHLIHSHWSYSFPASHLSRMPLERTVKWIWWQDGFEFEELTIHGLDNQRAALREYVQSVAPYSAARLRFDRGCHRLNSLGSRVRRRIGRMFG
ncbi:methyltransferase domain-containing protein [Humisphaera borealis]|uniref:Methyltransferase domain-containing protein n=1 Tax=Humisphaera borealis TaxID=2807512 RepID=A0A7M2WYT7_9BACT|nr:methyltransferase domain-containing protein [Humisphaera borealis]